MVATRQPVTVRLTSAQALRMERMDQTLWPGEKLSVAEVTRRLALTQLLWAESERGMVESVRSSA
jgi:DNA-binding GntR family transcriptional regulator